jgi:hypothetical protein
MATATPLHLTDVGRAIEKLVNEEPLTPEEGALVHRRVDALTLSDVDRVLRAFEEAPVGAPLSPEQEAECASRDEELRSGRVKGARHDEVQRKLEGMREQLGV